MPRSSSKTAPRRQSGLTYLWFLFLVVVLSLLLGVAAELDSTISRRDKELQLLAIGKEYRNAIGRYYEMDAGNGHVKEYPTSLDQLLRDNRVAGMRRHLRRVFIDPMTGRQEWGLVERGGRIVGVHSLSSQVPIKQIGFDPEDAALERSRMYSEWIFAYPANVIMKASSNAASAPFGRDGGQSAAASGTRP